MGPKKRKFSIARGRNPGGHARAMACSCRLTRIASSTRRAAGIFQPQRILQKRDLNGPVGGTKLPVVTAGLHIAAIQELRWVPMISTKWIGCVRICRTL